MPVNGMGMGRLKAACALLVFVGPVGGRADAVGSPRQGAVEQGAASASAVHPTVESAVDRGLAYLAGVQSEDGSFNGNHGRTTGVIGLCGMAFLAKGRLPGRGEHGDTINRCVDAVLRQRSADGYLGGVSGKMYSHSIATLFLLEVSGMLDADRRDRAGDAVAAALRVLLAAQAVDKPADHRGGWRYAPDSTDSDLSCSGWALLALRSARLNGAPVPREAVAEAIAYVRGNRNVGTGEFGYQDRATHSVTLTGCALLCLELTGHHGRPETFQAAEFILRSRDRLVAEKHRFYGNYYNAHALFLVGGRHWREYADWMRRQWLPLQRPDGSWAGLGDTWSGADDEPAYNTAMMLLALSAPFAQMPMHHRDESDRLLAPAAR